MSKSLLRHGATLLLATLVACGGTSEAPKPPAEKPAEKPATEQPLVLSADDLGEADSTGLVPSPVETQRALKAAGIETDLAGLIPPHAFDVEATSDEDAVAVRTGVLLADMLLAVKTADDDTLVANVEKVRRGLATLNSGADIDRTLQDMLDRIRGKSVSREELLSEFDLLARVAIPELTFNGRERVVPLIQAGSWLEAANLVAKAVQANGQPAAADALLKQPAVVDYFIKYVREEGAEKTSAGVAATLDQSLGTLKGLAAKPDALVEGDIATVIQVTDDVLSLL